MANIEGLAAALETNQHVSCPLAGMAWGKWCLKSGPLTGCNVDRTWAAPMAGLEAVNWFMAADRAEDKIACERLRSW
jgi:hypothetical protein